MNDGIGQDNFVPDARDDQSPRMRCLQACQAAHVACLSNAGNDEKKKAACNKALADCIARCPQN